MRLNIDGETFSKFDKAVSYLEETYGFEGMAWDMVVASDDLDVMAGFLHEDSSAIVEVELPKKFLATYHRSVTETYEAEILAYDEDEVRSIIWADKYGDGIDNERLIESSTDDVEVEDVEEVED